MHNSDKEKQSTYGILYVVATPIGNFNDISRRAVETLSKVNLIASEDTRHSKKLLTHLNIKVRQISYHKHNEQKISNILINNLIGGKNIALISDAGSPAISDPGDILIKKARQKGIHVSPIPGACSITSALSASGYGSENFQFIGFLPKQTLKKEKIFRKHILENSYSLVFFESPNRLIETLKNIEKNYSELCALVIAREISKIHEEIIELNIKECISRYESKYPEKCKGELVIILPAQDHLENKESLDDIENFLILLLSNDISYANAIKAVCSKYKLKKNEIYKKYIHLAKAHDSD